MEREIRSNPPSDDLVGRVGWGLDMLALLYYQDHLGLPVSRGETSYEDEKSYTVMVTKVPDGEAPFEVRTAWLEVVFRNCRLLQSGLGYCGMISRRPLPVENYRCFSVETLEAISALAENGTERELKAALWFLELPHLLGPHLCFRENEVMVLDKTELPKNRSFLHPRRN